jgi:hypothetical protein
MNKQEKVAIEAKENLLKYFNNPPENFEQLRNYFTVYTILKHVSTSGMMRVIDAYIIRDNIPLRLSWSVAEAIGMTYNRKHEGVQIGGCGMDMGFAIVNDLSRVLFTPKGERYNHDAAYKLNHRWIG